MCLSKLTSYVEVDIKYHAYINKEKMLVEIKRNLINVESCRLHSSDVCWMFHLSNEYKPYIIFTFLLTKLSILEWSI